MSNVDRVIEAVRAERVRAITELARLDEALRVLEKLAVRESKGGKSRTPKQCRKMSAAARRKITTAQCGRGERR